MRDRFDEILDRGTFLVRALENPVEVARPESPVENGEVLGSFASEYVESSFHDIVIGSGCRTQRQLAYGTACRVCRNSRLRASKRRS